MSQPLQLFSTLKYAVIYAGRHIGPTFRRLKAHVLSYGRFCPLLISLYPLYDASDPLVIPLPSKIERSSLPLSLFSDAAAATTRVRWPAATASERTRGRCRVATGQAGGDPRRASRTRGGLLPCCATVRRAAASTPGELAVGSRG